MKRMETVSESLKNTEKRIRKITVNSVKKYRSKQLEN